jgi:type IV secretion system protein TrbI
MADKVPPSPDSLQLRGTPTASARLSRKAVLTVIGVLAVILVFIVVNVSKENPKKAAAEDSKKELVPAVNAGKSILKDVPDVLPDLPPPPPREKELPPRLVQSPVPAKEPQQDPRLADTEVPKFVAGETLARHRAVAGWSAESPAQEDNGDNAPNSSAAANDTEPGAGTGLRGVSTVPGEAQAQRANEVDLNRQDEKLSFQQQALHSEYLNSRLSAPRSPFELKTGTVIPGLLVGAANSDLPGEIVAQVSQNVYDSASGEHLLIPQGTRLYGRYDSQISFGQGRLLVIWQRLIFPNAYTLELGGMSGHDQGGDAGFADRVNNHLARVFGAALLTSAFSAGAQLSQPQQATTTAVPTSGQVAAAAVGQQMSQVGAQIAERYLRVQPTIEIRKGYRFNVMVNKDVIFPGPYAP